MSSIDQKVVSMVFDNSKFQGAVTNTLGMLQKLTQALKLDKAASGLGDISKAARNVDLSSIGSKIDGLVEKFTGLKGVGTGALLAIGNQAVMLGQKYLANLTGQIRDGFGEYETKIGSIQTILANTRKHGTDLAAVSRELEVLNTYSDKTIYSFGDMTRNIGLFTNAGLKLEDSVKMIKGFSNEAAASGTTNQAAAAAAYQLSQALSAGQIRLMDWRSLTNAGMGNDNMKNGLLDVAKAMKTIDAKTATAAQKDFNSSLAKGWLTTEVMSKYLNIMTNDYSEAEIAAMGFSKEQAKAFKEQAIVAEEAATKVRTFTQLVGTIQEAAGSGWAKTFELLLGDFNEATELFTSINDFIGPMVQASADARNNIIQGWIDSGGKAAIFQGFQNILSFFKGVVEPVRGIISKMFPTDGGEGLTILSNNFLAFTERLKAATGASKLIQGVIIGLTFVFKALKGVLDFVVGGWLEYARVVGAVFNLIGRIFEPIGNALAELTGFGQAGGDILDKFFGTITRLRNEGITKLVESIDGLSGSLGGWDAAVDSAKTWLQTNSLLVLAGQKLQELWSNIVRLFNEVKAAIPGVMGQVGGFFASIPGHLQAFGQGFMDIYNKIKAMFTKAGGDASNFGQKAREAVTGFVEWFKTSLAGIDPNLIMSLLSSASLIMMAKQIGKFFKAGASFKDAFFDTLDGLKGKLTDALDSVTDAFKAMQDALEPDRLKSIGIAILAVAIAFKILSEVDPNRLQSAGIAMGIAIAALAGMMGVMKLFDLGGGIQGLTSMAGGLLLLAAAMLVMGFAMKQFATLEWEQIQKGLVGVGGGLLILSVATQMMSKSDNLIKAAFAMNLMALALLALSASVSIFGTMPWPVLLQGMGALMILLYGLAGAIRLMGDGKNLALVGVGLMAISLAISGMVGAIAILGVIPFPVIAQGLVTLAIMLGLLGAAVVAMQGNISGAGVILALALAINMLVPPLILLGTIPFETLAQGIFGIGAAFLVLGAAATVITPAQSAGLLAMAAALLLMGTSIAILGNMSLESIGVALLAMAASLAVLAVAGLAIAPLAPALIVLAAAMLAISLAMAIAGGALILFGFGLVGIGAGAAGAAAGMYILGQAMALLAPHAGSIAIMAGAFTLLGVAMVVAGAGALVLGTGLILLGAGLTLLAVSGGLGVVALQALVNAITGMLSQALALAAMAGTFTILGASLVVIGAGGLAAAVGALGFALAVSMVSAVVPMAETAIKALSAAFDAAGSSGGAATFAAAVGSVVIALGPMSAAAIGTAAGVLGLAAGLAGIAGISMSAAGGLAALSAGAIAVSASMKNSMSAMSSTVKNSTNTILETLGRLAPGVAASGASVAASTGIISTAFIAMGNQSAAAVVSSMAQIVSAMGPMPAAVQNTAAAVTAASNLMVTAFRNMGAQSAAGITASGSKIRSALDGIASDSETAAVAVGQRIIDGMVRGMSDSSAVTAAARRVANQALAAARKALGIASPSKEFEAIGAYSNEGFARGLLGYGKPTNPVDEAFKEMEEKIKTALDNANKAIEDAQADIDKYSKSPWEYRKELAEARRELAEAQRLKAMASTASTSLAGFYAKERHQITKLRNEYEAMLEKVDEAQQAYDDAVRDRDDAIKSFKDQFNKLPSVVGDDEDPMTYNKYISSMRDIVSKTEDFHQLLSKLRDKGLSDSVYKQLLEAGTDALPFLDDVMLMGDGAIENLNLVAEQLDKVSGDIGQKAGTSLYQAGVDMAKGILNGLESERDALKNAMESLANMMINKIKSDLGIRSPSRVMAEMGRNVGLGVSKGLKGSLPEIKKSATLVGEGLQSEIDKEFAKITDPLVDIFEGDPVIRPLLDLSDIESGSSRIADILAGALLSPDTSTMSASRNMARLRSGNGDGNDGTTGSEPTYQFNQYNTSPKSLNHGELYRQTNNLVTRVRKDVLS